MIEDLSKDKTWGDFGSKISEEQLSEILKRERLIAYFATIDLDVSAFTTGQIEHLAKLNSSKESQYSFVHQAGGAAEAIHGDEGIKTPPPYFGFDQSHRINAGIFGNRDAGLTTGHGSIMPSAWGDDEFLAPPNGELCQSGANNGNMRLQYDANSYDCSAQIQSADQKNE